MMKQHSIWGLQVLGGIGLDSSEPMLPAAPVHPARPGEMHHPAIPVAQNEMPDDWERLWIDLGGEG